MYLKVSLWCPSLNQVGVTRGLQRLPEVLCPLCQLLGKPLGLLERPLVGEVHRGLLGGHSQLLQEGTQVIALVQQVSIAAAAADAAAAAAAAVVVAAAAAAAAGGVSLMGLIAQCVDQPLADHDHQLTVGDEGLRGLAIQDAVHKLLDGPLQGTEVQAAVFREHRVRELLLGWLGW